MEGDPDQKKAVPADWFGDNGRQEVLDWRPGAVSRCRGWRRQEQGGTSFDNSDEQLPAINWWPSAKG